VLLRLGSPRGIADRRRLDAARLVLHPSEDTMPKSVVTPGLPARPRSRLVQVLRIEAIALFAALIAAAILSSSPLPSAA
jgi:hypothetical protein